MSVQQPTTVDDLLDLLAGLAGTASEGSPDLSELDHALQCADGLRDREPELRAAGLVHDIGHCFGPDDAHGRLGAAAVRPLLGDRVADLVEAHVPAKRYLVATTRSYRLSPISTLTLAAQGGPLSAAEAEAFRAAPGFAGAVALRRADDAAKVPGRQVPGLAHWAPLLRDLAGAVSGSDGETARR